MNSHVLLASPLLSMRSLCRGGPLLRFSCTSRSKDANVSYLPQYLPAVGGQAKRSSIDPMLVADSVHFFGEIIRPAFFSMGVDDVDVCSLCYFWVGFSFKDDSRWMQIIQLKTGNPPSWCHLIKANVSCVLMNNICMCIPQVFCTPPFVGDIPYTRLYHTPCFVA